MRVMLDYLCQFPGRFDLNQVFLTLEDSLVNERHNCLRLDKPERHNLGALRIVCGGGYLIPACPHI